MGTFLSFSTFRFILLGVALYGGWRRYQIEKINIKLIKQQQRLNQEKFELENLFNN